MDGKLPIKLKKEPLVDAIFELRFSCDQPASEIVPGYLFSFLKKDNPKISQLNISQLPKEIRESDPNLKYAPTTRIDWTSFFINVGDRSVSVCCQLPYPGWYVFKRAIKQMVDHLKNIGIINDVERCSLKYVDLIPSDDLADQCKFLNIKLEVADHALEKEVFQIRIDIPDEDGELINVVQLSSAAKVTLADGTTKKGTIIDIDTILRLKNMTLDSFITDIDNYLETIHYRNKKMFFDCLKGETIELLEPDYE